MEIGEAVFLAAFCANPETLSCGPNIPLPNLIAVIDLAIIYILLGFEVIDTFGSRKDENGDPPRLRKPATDCAGSPEKAR